MKPSVGRVVHYIPGVQPDNSSPCRAALITEVVSDELVHLVAFSAHDSAHWHNVPNSEPIHGRGSWHWPERVE